MKPKKKAKETNAKKLNEQVKRKIQKKPVSVHKSVSTKKKIDDSLSPVPQSSFYKNKATRYHPAYQISSDDLSWENLELTTSPTKNNRYIKLGTNPNPKSDKRAYVRKYIRKDPIKTRGNSFKNFRFTKDDQKQINDYINNNRSRKK